MKVFGGKVNIRICFFFVKNLQHFLYKWSKFQKILTENEFLVSVEVTQKTHFT